MAWIKKKKSNQRDIRQPGGIPGYWARKINWEKLEFFGTGVIPVRENEMKIWEKKIRKIHSRAIFLRVGEMREAPKGNSRVKARGGEKGNSRREAMLRGKKIPGLAGIQGTSS